MNLTDTPKQILDQAILIAILSGNVHLFRRRHDTPTPADGKPYRVTIHAAGDQWHTYQMGPGDAIGVAGIRVDIAADGGIHARPNAMDNDTRLQIVAAD